MFQKAKPVFPQDRAREMNLFLGFYTRIPHCTGAILRIAGASIYSVYLNGSFVFSGPARAAHGWDKVDEIPLGDLTEDNNLITILLSSYCCNSYYLLEEEGFLCAEFIDGDGKILSYTDEAGRGGFTCALLPERIQKVFRYSFQRTFSEAYRLDQNFTKFFRDPEHSGHTALSLTLSAPRQFKPRNLFLPAFETEYPVAQIAKGSIAWGEGAPLPRRAEHRSSPVYRCYDEGDLDYKYLDELSSLSFVNREAISEDAEQWTLSPHTYRDLMFHCELTGFLAFTVETQVESKLLLLFDEVYNGDTVNPLRLGCGNCITLFLKPGRYQFMTMEPYSLKYLRFVAAEGSVTVNHPHIRRAGFPEVASKWVTHDPDLKLIYDAAIETFRQNTYDIYMDCPSRERAGWLCDSFFTSRVEKFLTGGSEVEREFLTNFLDCKEYPGLPHGMLPMCYPADHPNHMYIPNWAMWFVLELEEYLKRTGDHMLIARAEPKVRELLHFFQRYENSDGLLEKLESWVFVEWSRSNKLTQDVNFPSNMLYARMKRAASHLYHDENLLREAERIECYIRTHTVVDGFFCDNALRQQDGTLRLSGECTETCQYYAFTMGIATPESHSELWQCLVRDFGPNRKKQNKYPAIAFSNSFIGNYLRLDLLYRYGKHHQLIDEIKGYFLYMAKKTGTLWENDTDHASCNHGFASYVAFWLAQCGN